MSVKGWAITMGIGAAAGAVAVMMLPKQCTARKMVTKAAVAVDDAVCDVKQKIEDKLDM